MNYDDASDAVRELKIVYDKDNNPYVMIQVVVGGGVPSPGKATLLPLASENTKTMLVGDLTRFRS